MIKLLMFGKKLSLRKKSLDNVMCAKALSKTRSPLARIDLREMGFYIPIAMSFGVHENMDAKL
jgi:hypothetical protein